MIKKINLLLLLISFSIIGISQDIDKIFGDRPEVYFSFQFTSGDEVESLSKIISIDNLASDGIIYAYANKKGFADFLTRQIEYEVLTAPSMLHQPRMLDEVNIKDIKAWDFYPTYDAYVSMMYQFEADYPDLCDVFSIGYTNNDHELLVARISDNVGQAEGEPKFLYTATMHGDETTGYVLTLRLIDLLLSSYGDNPRLTSMVDEIDIFINPLANPDGTFYSSNNNIYGAVRYNAMGVDLNRNYADPKDGPHPDGNPWQTETKHFMNFAEQEYFQMSANLHGGTEVCNYPWDTWWELSADDDWWVYVCREYADTAHVHAPSNYMTGYDNGITNGYAWYSISGGRQDYMNYFHGTREFTLEISDDKLLPANQLPDLWDYNQRSLLNYIEQVLFGLRGRITDSATGEALEAEVYVVGHEEDSSWAYSVLPEGNYSRLLNEGTYDIRFKKPGYITQVHENVVINNREATFLDIELVKSFSSVGEFENESFSIFPNPIEGESMTVKALIPIDRISIYAMNGMKVQELDLKGEMQSQLDISNLNPGTYIMNIETAGKSYQRKFIKL